MIDAANPAITYEPIALPHAIAVIVLYGLALVILCLLMPGDE